MSELKINPNKTALVVIDLQKGIVGRETAPYSAASVVDNASLIADAFRKKKMPVFLVRVKMADDGKDRLDPVTDDQMMGMGSLPPDWAEIVPKMGPKSDDFVITKHQWGAFYGTELDLECRRRGVDTIVLCGISTNIGVESTARFAYEYGYNQVFVEDAMTALSEQEHNFTTTKTLPRMGLVRSTKQVIAAI